MKISEVFKVITTRPLDALDKVGIAELAQFTTFTLHNFPFSAAWQALVNEWKFEYNPRDDEYQTMNGLMMFFKDGSSITLKQK
jgi:hypothetical protein